VEDVHFLPGRIALGRPKVVVGRNSLVGCSDLGDLFGSNVENILDCSPGHRTVEELHHEEPLISATDEGLPHELALHTLVVHARAETWSIALCDDGTSVRAVCCTQQIAKETVLVQNCQNEKAVCYVFVEACGDQDQWGSLELPLQALAEVLAKERAQEPL
jgi:hypothetical protein